MARRLQRATTHCALRPMYLFSSVRSRHRVSAGLMLMLRQRHANLAAARWRHEAAFASRAHRRSACERRRRCLSRSIAAHPCITNCPPACVFMCQPRTPLTASVSLSAHKYRDLYKTRAGKCDSAWRVRVVCVCVVRVGAAQAPWTPPTTCLSWAARYRGAAPRTARDRRRAESWLAECPHL